jgi:RNA-binding protein
MNTPEPHTSTSISRLKKKAKILKPVVWIGKAGITRSVIEEINKQLTKNKLIKVKLLNSLMKGKNREAIVKEVIEKTKTLLVDKVGFVVVLTKKD